MNGKLQLKKNRVDEFIKNPRKALFTLAGPIVIGMVVQTLYNIVDTAFVGRLGADAIAALTFSFPIFFILISLNAGVGIGMGSVISRYLGAKNKTAAENSAEHGLLISVILAAAIFLVTIFFLRDIFTLFGATETVVELAMGYMSVVLMGSIFMFPAYVMNNIFSSEGDTKTPMKIQVTSLVLNMILDPIFIYVLGYGVKGAAIATVISFTVSFVLGLYFISTKSFLRINPKSFKLSPHIMKNIIKVGFPATLMMLLISVYIIFINKIMSKFGTEYVAAFGIVSRLESLSNMPIVALAMAVMTLVGMFYGAKRYDLIRDTVYYAMKVVWGFSILIGVVLFIFPKLFLSIFTNDANLIAIATSYLRIVVLTLPMMGTTITASRTFQAMGFGAPGLIINLVRIVFTALPLAYVFVYVLNYGFISIPWAMVIGGAIGTVVALVWLNKKIHYMEKKKIVTE